MLLSYPRDFSPFMEPEGSLPCSQNPSTCSYTESNESSLQTSTLFL